MGTSSIIISIEEFQEAWVWFLDHISIEMSTVEELGYFLDHKHWQYPHCTKCIDECENADIYLARLYLVGQLASVSDYLEDLINYTFSFYLDYAATELDIKIGRVINAKETKKNRNSFRDSLSEHLAFWAILASIIKESECQNFSITKPNLQPENQGLDGLACLVFDEHLIIKIISIKNSINSPQDAISSSKFRNGSDTDLNDGKIFDEFYNLQEHNRGFQELDDILNKLLQELQQRRNRKNRRILFEHHGQFNATVIANEKFFGNQLFQGFERISEEPNQRIGIYIGSENWKSFANDVQKRVQEILALKGVAF